MNYKALDNFQLCELAYSDSNALQELQNRGLQPQTPLCLANSLRASYEAKMIKSNRLSMFLLRLELFATFEQFIHIAFYLHIHNYKSKLNQGRTKPAKLWLEGVDNYLGNKFLNGIRFIKNDRGVFIF